MALQRNLKALGTFGYQTTARRNPVYIQYIPRTLRYVRANLERYPRFGRLRELLAQHVEELAVRTGPGPASCWNAGPARPRMDSLPAGRNGALHTCGSASRRTSTTTSG